MSLGGGRFGPPLKTEHTDKEWFPVTTSNWRKQILRDMNHRVRQIDINWLFLDEYLYSNFKFYGAEYLEDNT